MIEQKMKIKVLKQLAGLIVGAGCLLGGYLQVEAQSLIKSTIFENQLMAGKHSNKTTTSSKKTVAAKKSASTQKTATKKSSSTSKETPRKSKATKTKSSAATMPVTVNYHRGEGNESATLSQNYQKYHLYNHVTDSGYFTYYYNWNNVPAAFKRRVYVDARAVKKTTGTTWYRIRFAKAAKAQKYWVYAKALTFDEVKYVPSTQKIKIKHGSYALRSHVYNSEDLSLVKGSAKSILNRTYKANQEAVKFHSKGFTIWYRFRWHSKNVWICQQAVQLL
ncbi:hypothetical protein YK48G_25350 [Lentilactobacillus fungorum]|uniref:Surface layer protein A domain-containing protein n=1 Tax=Lentilactobacillus fungorum TaxID=2201250 RepID=A0ABQ3W1P7_9LACO|nr:hypothetical protein [Lentilactobacillus fungorum]GHP15110.1 hypothetical protein YK48G_25350 [Lentilactobacillus fungorum]